MLLLKTISAHLGCWPSVVFSSFETENWLANKADKLSDILVVVFSWKRFELLENFVFWTFDFHFHFLMLKNNYVTAFVRSFVEHVINGTPRVKTLPEVIIKKFPVLRAIWEIQNRKCDQTYLYIKSRGISYFLEKMAMAGLTQTSKCLPKFRTIANFRVISQNYSVNAVQDINVELTETAESVEKGVPFLFLPRS